MTTESGREAVVGGSTRGTKVGTDVMSCKSVSATSQKKNLLIVIRGPTLGGHQRVELISGIRNSYE